MDELSRTTGPLLSATRTPAQLPDKFPTSQQVLATLREQDKTPLVRFLGAVIEEQGQRLADAEQRIAALEAEIDRLNAGKHVPRPPSKPSALSTAPTPTQADGKRPGSTKRSKTQELPIDAEIPCRPANLPPGSTWLRSDPFVVQDLLIQRHTVRYLLETWRTPSGETVRGELPAGVRGHVGAGLQSFVLQMHYVGHVPQPRIWEMLQDYQVDLSSGQVNNLVTEGHAVFHAEKDEVLAAGLQASTYVNVDDSGAPHQGHYGSCLCICNEWFTSFHSSDTKARSKFLDVLRCGACDYTLNEAAWAYLDRYELPAALLQRLREHPQQTFAERAAWEHHLQEVQVTNRDQRQTLTEAALLGSAVAHGVSAELGVLSDGSTIYAVLVHGLCWVHQERILAKLVPCGEQAQAQQEVLTALWALYDGLKAYRAAPCPTQAEELRRQFDQLVGRTTCWPELNAALQRMAARKADLLRVLERPDLPLQNNTAERDFRDWATKRKISSGTRGEAGRRCRDTFLSLKATCRKLGLRFWEYVKDRLTKAGVIPRLSELVRQKATASATT